MSKLLRTPEHLPESDISSRYQRFGLLDNPFPSEPYVNQDSTDKRINGNIYETELHKKEYQQILKNFLSQSQANPNHLRLGYIIDTSYIGRGNGKSAFLVNLKQIIDKDYCEAVSDGKNKCFSIYVRPEPGGRTKTFPGFVDIFFQAIIKADVIKSTLAVLRLKAIQNLYPNVYKTLEGLSDENIINILDTEEWFNKNNIDLISLSEEIYKDAMLQKLPSDFPIFCGRSSWLPAFVSTKDFVKHYTDNLKKSSDKIHFIFTQLVDFFLSAKFNGAYVLVDDFERIPDFQSERQKRDFALELRSCLFDGPYTNSRIGFYNFLLVFHAGVPRLIGDAWYSSGMEHRAPILPKVSSKHVIRFESLTKQHVVLLLRKYLSEYRISNFQNEPLFPFTEDGVQRIGEISEYNAARVLRTAHELLERAAGIDRETVINSGFIDTNLDMIEAEPNGTIPTIKKTVSLDLQKKAKGKK